MTELKRDSIQDWIKSGKHEAYICPDCEGIHLNEWEEREAVLEARCFVEKERISLLVEIAIRPSAVLPLQGAVHFMNYDHGLIKVMISMSDHDVPRLLLTHAIPNLFVTEEYFHVWFTQMVNEMEAVYKHLQEMEVLLIDDEAFLSEFDDQLH
jgi:hypothetical protein